MIPMVYVNILHIHCGGNESCCATMKATTIDDAIGKRIKISTPNKNRSFITRINCEIGNFRNMVAEAVVSFFFKIIQAFSWVRSIRLFAYKSVDLEDI